MTIKDNNGMTLSIELYENWGEEADTGRLAEWSHDFFGMANDDDVVEDVMYCLWQARDWVNNAGDYGSQCYIPSDSGRLWRSLDVSVVDADGSEVCSEYVCNGYDMIDGGAIPEDSYR